MQDIRVGPEGRNKPLTIVHQVHNVHVEAVELAAELAPLAGRGVQVLQPPRDDATSEDTADGDYWSGERSSWGIRGEVSIDQTMVKKRVIGGGKKIRIILGLVGSA